MSVFAGIYSLNQGPNGVRPPGNSVNQIIHSISRADWNVETWANERFFLAKIDIGAFPEEAFVRTEDSIGGTTATVAGHPFLASPLSPTACRASQLSSICHRLDTVETGVLLACQGVFALCHYRVPEGRLILATDRVGARPLYYYIDKDHLYFSTALRVLEKIRCVPKRMDVQGIAEKIAFGYPLSHRTAYYDIHVLENGQFLDAHDGELRVVSYFKWDEVAPTTLQPDELLNAAHEVFVGAVARQSSGQEIAVSNLSGGLDSRCIVSTLHDLKKGPYVLSWNMEGYIDTELARRFAEALGLHQVFRPIPAYPTQGQVFPRREHYHWPGIPSPSRPALVYSGDGGSVGVGYDYLNEERVGWMRSGQIDRMIDFFSQDKIPRRFLRKDFCRQLCEALRDGIRDEFAQINSHDPGKDLYIFYMRNDQRRHLYQFYENIDECGVDLILPFFYGEFVELIGSGPVDAFLYHRFYYNWLDRFSPITKAIPWQSYPDHLPCPVPLELTGRRQWDKKRNHRFLGRNRQALGRCLRALFDPRFPSHYLIRPNLLAAAALQSMRWKCYTYALEAGAEVHELLKKTNGAVVFPHPCSDTARAGSI